MDDLISRQALLDRLDHPTLGDRTKSFWTIVKEMPTIEPKHGKWIYKTQNVKGGKGQTYGKWQCSCCKKKEPRRRNYCPNCGARMERSEE